MSVPVNMFIEHATVIGPAPTGVNSIVSSPSAIVPQPIVHQRFRCTGAHLILLRSGLIRGRSGLICLSPGLIWFSSGLVRHGLGLGAVGQRLIRDGSALVRRI